MTGERTGLSAGWTEELERELRRSMPPGALLGLVLEADDRVLELGLLRVSAAFRDEGHVGRVLTRICAEADARALTIVCTPTDEFGADRSRLENLFRRHGFAPVAAGDRLSEHPWERPPEPRPASVGPTVPHQEPRG
ncbi:hypothetical protein KZO11_36845 [Streptomyces anulatus]|uniref:hypothetical protein n=1 Tax=Streptomyces anulatus TaxID=1892 RepID=UPI001C602A3F|nr:hypothetical protein [Streptomyces anulatus]QYA98742.1 hypothetical protein KZO11_36845 [Streptomyces anulatus]